MIIDRILQKIDTLSVYSFFLPSETKSEFVTDLDKIKEDISLSIENLIETLNSKPHLATFVKEVLAEEEKNEQLKLLPEKIPLVSLPEQPAVVDLKPEKRVSEKQTFVKQTIRSDEKTLFSISKVLIPNLTNKGKTLISKENSFKKIKSLLMLINDKSPLSELYNLYSYNYDNYLEFLNLYFELETNGFIKFIKSENIPSDSAWVRLGRIFVECNLLNESELNSALELQESSQIQIGKAMLELNYIDNEILDTGLKIQNWISKITENSIFIEGLSQSNSLHTTNPDGVTKIFDFIVPAFTYEAKNKLTGTQNQIFRKLVDIINEHSSLLNIFEKNKGDFKNDKIEFFKLILKLDNQKILNYFKNEVVQNRDAWVRFGELAINLGLINEKQVEETFLYRYKNPDKKLYIGTSLVELNYLSEENLNYILKIQNWCNNTLARVSYENAFINGVKEVLEDYFKLPTTFGKFTAVTYKRPLTNIICITYTFKGHLKGKVFYICDRNFVEKLTEKLAASFGLSSKDLDESVIAELCNMITGNSLTKLSKVGVFCETDIPEIDFSKEIMVANGETINILPLSNQFGRFIIGFLIDN